MKYPKSKLREVRFVNYDTEVAEALAFEMVGKFTSGCETSESERDYSGSEVESELSDEESLDLEEVEEDDVLTSEQTPEQKNIIANNLAQRRYVTMKAQARRQSIA